MCDKVHCIKERVKTNHHAVYSIFQGKYSDTFLKGQRNLYLIQCNWKALYSPLDGLRRILNQIYKAFYNPKSHWNQRSWKSNCGSCQWPLFFCKPTDWFQFSLKCSVHKILTYSTLKSSMVKLDDPYVQWSMS